MMMLIQPLHNPRKLQTCLETEPTSVVPPPSAQEENEWEMTLCPGLYGNSIESTGDERSPMSKHVILNLLGMRMVGEQRSSTHHYAVFHLYDSSQTLTRAGSDALLQWQAISIVP